MSALITCSVAPITKIDMESNDFKISATFQKRLNDYIAEQDCKKSELPALIGINKDVFIRAANLGILPSTRSIQKIADYFDASFDYLIGLTDKDIFIKSASPVSFGQRLDELKHEKKVTFGKIATALGFSRSLFNSWTKNNYLPTVEIAFSLSQYFNVTIDFLLGRSERKNFSYP